ncbi:MAG: RNB domain-containing ribonuclease, partial [Candidatus Thermoplasmatota archaeon]|nr:RNB domain-containing ribonuclease [Candidatus Thermoplasmatota archaeon]
LLLQNQKITIAELLDLRLAARKRDGRNPFPRYYDEQLVEHSNLQSEVDGDSAVKDGREDLRHLPFVTIDPNDAKDFDDAVCLIEKDGVSTLWVAIADVAHYVQKDTRLDNSARARATSVYLPHTVLPMLPPRLADNLCSLREDVDRLAMVVAMELNKDGEIVDSKAYEAVIRVTQNLAYEDAIGNDKFANMFALAEKWQAREVRLNISNAEMRPRILPDEQIKVLVKWPTDATRMIESFMVATNACVGHMLGKAGAPLPWRCHAPPDSAEVKELNAKLAALKVDIELPMPSLKTHGQSDSEELSNLLGAWANTTIEALPKQVESPAKSSDVAPYLSNVLDPDARQDILDSLMVAQNKASSLDDTTRRIVDQGLFQLMQRANYSTENLGHFGLNLDAYVHFTSPIRRYPDLVAHRQLKAIIKGQDWPHDEEETTEISEHCSNQSVLAKYIEWELVANAYHIHLLRGGEIDSTSENIYPSVIEKSWPARIVGLRTPWVFLDLNDDGAIQGRMHLRQMGSKQRLNIDENGLEVRSAEPDQNGDFRLIAKLGQKYPCRLRGIDIWSGSLDLAPK